jgi:hypothetical protein
VSAATAQAASMLAAVKTLVMVFLLAGQYAAMLTSKCHHKRRCQQYCDATLRYRASPPACLTMNQ